MTNTLKSKIFDYAINQLRFDDCRFADVDLKKATDIYRAWLAQNHFGDMEYLERHAELKSNPEKLLKDVKSAVVVCKNYKNTSERQLKTKFKIARYAAGKDYHTVIGQKLTELARFLKNASPDTECYCGVDSSPIPERSLAIKAGAGFLGKNTMVIKPGLGSYFFIGVILTTETFGPDEPLKWNCGSCRLCIDACPTSAIQENYTLNAGQCLSYLTIEKKSPMTENELAQSQGWLFGCDICQEVCPYNHDNITLTDWPQFLPSNGIGFDFKTDSIPKNTALYRSRKRLLANVNNLKR